MHAALRYASVALLAVWLGGQVFHGAVVVPAAHDVLGGHREIGFVTRRAAAASQLLGGTALAVLLARLAAAWPARSRRERGWDASTLGVMALALSAQVVLHGRLDALLDIAAMRVADRGRFLWLHERYLNATSVLVLAGALHLGGLLRSAAPPPTAGGSGRTPR